MEKEQTTVIDKGELIAHLPIHLTKYKDGRLRLSPSRLGAFDECKAKFKAQVLGNEPEKNTIYSLVGKAAHTILEKLNTGWKADAEAREDAFREELIRLCEETTTPLSFPKGYKESRDTIVGYSIPSNWNVFSIECKQVLRFTDFDFSYIADGIFNETYDDTVIIVDFKTNASVPKSPSQLYHYFWATIHRHPELKGRNFKVAYHMLRKNKLVYYDISWDLWADLERQMKAKVQTILGMIKLDYFPTEPSNDACRWCPITSCASRISNQREEEAGADEIMEGFGK